MWSSLQLCHQLMLLKIQKWKIGLKKPIWSVKCQTEPSTSPYVQVKKNIYFYKSLCTEDTSHEFRRSFFCVHEQQKDFFKRSHVDVKNFIKKYVEPP
jgi:hypothetical protein